MSASNGVTSGSDDANNVKHFSVLIQDDNKASFDEVQADYNKMMEITEGSLPTNQLTERQMERIVLFPIKSVQEAVKTCYEVQRSFFWTEMEIDFSRDKYDYEYKLDDNERHLVINTLAFFANSDQLVFENLVDGMMREIDDPWIRIAWGYQAAVESIHAITYNLSIENLIGNGKEKDELFAAARYNPAVKPKIACVSHLISAKVDLIERIIYWCFVEGVFFSTSFATIFWVRKKGLMPGVALSNEFIIRDECLHVIEGANIYEYLAGKHGRLTNERIYEIADEMVALETDFAKASILGNMKGMNIELMTQYIKKTADTVLNVLGLPAHYNVANPFPYMENLGLLSKSNFFEKRVGEYQRAVICPEMTQKVVAINDDF